MTEIHDLDHEFDQGSTYLFASIYDKTCYLWFGEQSSIRKKFIAAKEARNITIDTGFTSCRIQEEDAQEEFDYALELWRDDDVKYSQPAEVINEQRSRLKKLAGSRYIEPPKKKPLHHRGRKKVKRRAKAASAVEIEPTQRSATDKNLPSEEELMHILAKLSSLDMIPGHELDYVVTTGHVYSVMWDADTPLLKYLEDVKDGVFEVKHYLPRFYIENSRLLAIELWRSLD